MVDLVCFGWVDLVYIDGWFDLLGWVELVWLVGLHSFGLVGLRWYGWLVCFG